jgi:23S rRNA U2552 (ribose-2'-O)-methylase RlmE/FtsJ
MVKKLVKRFRKLWHKDLLLEMKEMKRQFNDLNEKTMFLMKQAYNGKPEDELSFLFDFYGSDKGSIYRYRKNVHTYTDTYHSLFSPVRDKVKAVFECGIFRGASLRVWRDYFSKAMIIGGDIDETSLFEDVRIHTDILDQMNPKIIKMFLSSLEPKYPNNFDIIIDDGCHIYEATLCLFENSIDFLKPDGIYVIEDMLEKHFQEYKEYFRKYVDENKIMVEYKIMSNITGDPHNTNLFITKYT